MELDDASWNRWVSQNTVPVDTTDYGGPAAGAGPALTTFPAMRSPRSLRSTLAVPQKTGPPSSPQAVSESALSPLARVTNGRARVKAHVAGAPSTAPSSPIRSAPPNTNAHLLHEQGWVLADDVLFVVGNRVAPLPTYTPVRPLRTEDILGAPRHTMARSPTPQSWGPSRNSSVSRNSSPPRGQAPRSSNENLGRVQAASSRSLGFVQRPVRQSSPDDKAPSVVERIAPRPRDTFYKASPAALDGEPLVPTRWRRLDADPLMLAPLAAQLESPRHDVAWPQAQAAQGAFPQVMRPAAGSRSRVARLVTRGDTAPVYQMGLGNVEGAGSLQVPVGGRGQGPKSEAASAAGSRAEGGAIGELVKLHKCGLLTHEEFAMLKRRAMSGLVDGTVAPHLERQGGGGGGGGGGRRGEREGGGAMADVHPQLRVNPPWEEGGGNGEGAGGERHHSSLHQEGVQVPQTATAPVIRSNLI